VFSQSGRFVVFLVLGSLAYGVLLTKKDIRLHLFTSVYICLHLFSQSIENKSSKFIARGLVTERIFSLVSNKFIFRVHTPLWSWRIIHVQDVWKKTTHHLWNIQRLRLWRLCVNVRRRNEGCLLVSMWTLKWMATWYNTPKLPPNMIYQPYSKYSLLRPTAVTRSNIKTKTWKKLVGI
jgi:hypothetical protein